MRGVGERGRREGKALSLSARVSSVRLWHTPTPGDLYYSSACYAGYGRVCSAQSNQLLCTVIQSEKYVMSSHFKWPVNQVVSFSFLLSSGT